MICSDSYLIHHKFYIYIYIYTQCRETYSAAANNTSSMLDWLSGSSTYHSLYRRVPCNVRDGPSCVLWEFNAHRQSHRLAESVEQHSKFQTQGWSAHKLLIPTTGSAVELHWADHEAIMDPLQSSCPSHLPCSFRPSWIMRWYYSSHPS